MDALPHSIDLFTACRSGDLEAVRATVARGADANEASPDDLIPGHPGETPLHAAIGTLSSWSDAVLANGRYIPARNTPPPGMSLVVSEGDGKYLGRTLVPSDEVFANILAIVTFLIEHGADVNAEAGPARETPLAYTAQFGNEGIARALIAAGASVKVARGRKGPLHYACYSALPSMLRLLILLGRADADDLNTPDYQNFTPLCVASLVGSLPCVELLLAAKADVSIHGHLGHTALHEACYSGDPEIVKSLLAAGADRHAKDHYNSTPYELACKLGPAHRGLARLLCPSSNL